MNELVVGIDEAGLGPILGPFCLAAYASKRTWSHPIKDSKKLHKKNGDLSPLRSACDIYCSGFNWDAFRKITVDLCSKDEPWFPSNDSDNSYKKDDGAAHFFNSRSSDGLSEIWCQSVGVDRFNHGLSTHHNKSDYTNHLLKDMVLRVLTGHPDEKKIKFLIDRQGGRKHYTDLLTSWGFEVVEGTETLENSSYQARFKAMNLEFEFIVKGDQTYHHIAAASCFAKLRRELAMEQFNRWWLKACPGLKKTAGYWTDGQRFLKDIEFLIDQRKMNRNSLIRNK